MKKELIEGVEVIELEPVEEVASGISGKRLATLGVAAATIGAGYLLVTKVVIPAIKKRKAKKEEEALIQDSAVTASYEDDFEEE